jgi:ABC-type multidrug transport system fused ATPase/permease subunit
MTVHTSNGNIARPRWQKLETDPRLKDGGTMGRLRFFRAWLYPELTPYRLQMTASWLLLAILSAVSATPILLARKIVQDFEGDSQKLPFHLVMLALVILGISLLRFLATLTLSTVTFRVRHALEEQFARRLASTPLSYYENNTSGSISLAPFNQIPLITGLVDVFFRNFIQAGATIIAVLAALFYADITVGLYCALLIPLFFFGVNYFGKSAELSIKRTFARISDLHSQILESLISVKSIRTLGISEERVKNVISIAGETMRGERTTLVLTEASRFVVETVFAVGLVLVLLVLYAQFAGGKMSLSLCAAALTGFGLLAREVKSMVNGLIILRRTVGASSQIFDFLSQPQDATTEGTRDDGTAVTSVSLVGVSFSYDGKNEVLHDVNMTFNRGDITGIVGMSGAGKSTLADLILRLRKPLGGKITINGTDIAEFSERWMRKTFAFVDQEPFLFNTTIRENLTLAAPGLPDAGLTAALSAAGALAFVSAFPNGLATRVGEGGSLLSVGEKQRIAVARALVRQPAVLVLDEVTSALDAENEQVILDTLSRLSKDMVIILISHKEKVMSYCQKIYHLEEGRIRPVKG